MPLAVSESRVGSACGEVQKREGGTAWTAPQRLHLARAVGLKLPAALNGAGGDVHEGCLLSWQALCEHHSAAVEQCWASKRTVHSVCWWLATPASQLLRFELSDGSAPQIVNDLLSVAMLRPHSQVVLALCKRQLTQCGRVAD